MTGIALALGGGSALGWAHIGVLRALQAGEVPAAAVAGTSIGALVAACYAANRLDALEGIARDMRWWTTIAYLDPLLGRGALLGGRRIARMLAQHLGHRRLEDLPIPVALVAADLATGDEIRLAAGPIAPAVRASIALPGIFAPERRDGRWLIDGGMIANVPLAAAAALAPGRPLVAVDLFADYAGFVAASGGVEAIGTLGAARAGFQMLMRRQTRQAASTIPIAAMIAPRVGAFSPAAFHRAAALIDAGRVAGEAALPAIRGHLASA
ncbi:MAG: patatin-like phospholipase family protein [Sphingomonas fennica]